MLKLLPTIILTAIGIVFLMAVYVFLHKDNTVNFLEGVHITSLNRIIIHQDGSQGQPNPPVNIDQHLVVSGDFKITATLLQIEKQASIRLYSSPPIVYDQWRSEPPSVEVMVDATNNLITVRVWDGSSPTSMDMRTYNLFVSPKMIIALEHVGSQINIIEDGRLLGSIPDHNIFKAGTVWFGFDAAPGSNGWTLGALIVAPLEHGDINIIRAPIMTAKQNDLTNLRNLANNKKIKIGSAINTDVLFFDEKYRNLALSQFSIFTPENSLKPQFIHPMPDVYDYAIADQLVDVALKNNITIHGHALVYSKSSPDWMTKSPKENLQKIMVDHITNVVDHFKGKIGEWDVINEPFSQKHALYGFGKSGLDQSIWQVAMGEKYIDLAFQTAHKVDPDAKLYLNDYGIENDGQHWDALLNLVKGLKQRGVPIDGVGFEGHIYTDGDYIHKDQLKKHMDQLANLGLLTRISEIDVTGDDPAEQIKQYVLVLDVCLRAPNCTSYTTWGITDKYGSTTRSDRYPAVYGTSLLWDKDMKAKPVYSALQGRLGQNF